MSERPVTAAYCPICKKPAAEKYKPFCGPRCAAVDLNRWLSGAYVVPAREEEDENDSVPKDGEHS